MKTGTFVTILMVSLLASNPLLAGDGDRESHSGMRGPGGGMGMHGMPDPERMVRHISTYLDLDENTTQELTNVVLVAKPQMLALRDKARANRAAIATADDTASDYSATIHALAVESGQIATELILLASQLRVDIHSKLTDEQRLELKEGFGEMRHRRDGKKRAHGDETEL